MKHVCVTVIVLVLLGADMASSWQAHPYLTDHKSWDLIAGFGLIFAAYWFWHHRDGAA